MRLVMWRSGPRGAPCGALRRCGAGRTARPRRHRVTKRCARPGSRACSAKRPVTDAPWAAGSAGGRRRARDTQHGSPGVTRRPVAHQSTVAAPQQRFIMEAAAPQRVLGGPVGRCQHGQTPCRCQLFCTRFLAVGARSGDRWAAGCPPRIPIVLRTSAFISRCWLPHFCCGVSVTRRRRSPSANRHATTVSWYAALARPQGLRMSRVAGARRSPCRPVVALLHPAAVVGFILRWGACTT